MSTEEEIAAFEQCSQELLRDLLGICRRAVRRRFPLPVHELDDIAIEAVVRATEGLSGFRGECSLRTWIVQIAMNVASEYARRHPTISLDDPDVPADVLAAQSAEENLTARLVMDEVMSGLSEVERQVLELDAEGHSDREIGARVGRSVDGIYSLRKRLRARLREQYKELEG